MSKKTFTTRARDALKLTTVEPFLFLAMFALNTRIVALQSLLHDRACRISLNMSLNICNNLEDHENELEQSHAIAYGNNIYNAYVMMATVPALVVATFLGPWSDRYSRKYPLLLSTTGMIIDACIQTTITWFEDASPFWFLISAAISGCTGGFIVMLSSTYSYMSDITDERSRQMRFAVLEFFTILATPAGSFVGGQVFRVGKYFYVMLMGPILLAMAWLWLRLYVQETKPKRFDITKKEMCLDLFKLDNLKDSFKTCAQPRPGNLRLQIWLLLFVSFSLRFVNMGSLSIGFPYTRNMFKWDVPRYSYTTTVFSLINAASTLVVVPFLNRRLMVHEAAVGLVGVLSLMAKMVLMAVTVHEYIIFYAWFSGTLFACGGIAIRSRISKLVSKKELGRVFALLATCESFTPVLGTITMTQIYHASLGSFKGLAYACAAISLLPSAAIFFWMMSMPTMSIAQYQDADQAKNMEELHNVANQDFGYSELKEEKENNKG